MTKLKLFGTAALALSLATPVMAQDAAQRPGHDTHMNTRVSHQRQMRHVASNRTNRNDRGMGQRSDGRMAYRGNANAAYRDTNGGWDRHDSGFWPGEVAADAVGGAADIADAAVGTAGAIATAPFRNDSYAYDNNGYNNGWNNNWDRRDQGFWPGNVAADAVGGAVATADAAIGTAGAIATAPFRNDSYAYDTTYNGWDRRTYAQRNGFVCEPGTWFKGDDGRRHICQ